MTHVRSLADAKPAAPTLLTIGSFDGVHCGHQALVTDMVSAARSRDWQAVVLTFFPHPSVVLRGRRPAFYIHRPEEKAAALGALGVDWVVTLPFDERRAQTTAADFTRQLRCALDFRQLRCGGDFAFGRGREGDVAWLREHSPDYRFELRVVAPVQRQGGVVSSSRVRAYIRAGDVAAAAGCLGRPLRVPGTVEPGVGRGRSIGVPTANLTVWSERACPASGVYAALAWLEDESHAAVVNVGVRPTFEDGSRGVTIEAHLLDFNGDLYGRRLALDFIKRLRAERKFEHTHALGAQIKADVTAARTLLAEPENRWHPIEKSTC
ncbi:MAG: riboflavin biosynthesis protein RibF, partial [Anaerolineales bacterium]|jgi:riboflavin kinase/FMN adenylyltransferase|nr:riboflavin biosynthesis protein RibF [Anaerolineales bacterium]